MERIHTNVTNERLCPCWIPCPVPCQIFREIITVHTWWVAISPNHPYTLPRVCSSKVKSQIKNNGIGRTDLCPFWNTKT